MRTTPNNRVAICVVGCGHWGKNLVRNFHQLGHLYAICETSPVLRAAIQAQYPKAVAYASLEEALADPKINAVAIATPAPMHHEMTMAALKADKDVFVEKPLALTWDSEELIASGELGDIEYIYSNRLSMGKIRRDENALWSFAPHDISVLLALTRQLPLQVVATGGAYLQPNIADVTVSQLLFDHGTRAHIFVSWLHPYKEQRLVVMGSKKMAVFEDTAPANKLIVFDKQIELKDGSYNATKPKAKPISFSDEEPLLRECRHFVECVETGSKPLTPGDEGVLVLQVLQACHWSLQMNGQPVALHEARALRQTTL
jgi:UDP-2-acetamido-3-amino-2,3-dideoxy-glucuronate N-acetyltransferase